MPKVFWSLLSERYIHGLAVDAALDIAAVSILRGYTRISMPYMRTDVARNRLMQSFLELSTDPNDTIIMLDCDMVHPQDVTVRLASHPPEIGVVGVLYFRRGPPYDPLFFARRNGQLRNPAEWLNGALYECDALGTGGIAIKRWVLDKLDKAGYPQPFFQYRYPEDSGWVMTEDIFFAESCEKAGILHYCDTSLVSPHLGLNLITEETWRAYLESNPDHAVKVPQED